jgi:hypothetical protein
MAGAEILFDARLAIPSFLPRFVAIAVARQ